MLMTNVYETLMMTIFKTDDIFNRSDVVDKLMAILVTISIYVG